MREVSEGEAEGFRRREKRIRERKRIRGRVLACCIPIGLCIAAWSVIILPTMLNAGNNTMTDDEKGNVAGNTGSNFSCPYSEVVVQDTGKSSEFYNKETDEVKVRQLFNVIQNAFYVEDQYKPEMEDGNARDPGSSAEEPAQDPVQGGIVPKPLGYTITFSNADGSQLVYTFEDGTLINEFTGEKIMLTAEESSELIEIFGLTNREEP